MPAPLAAGGPIILCPGGSAGAIVRFLSERSADNHQHHSQHEHGSDDYEAWEYCPVGASLSAAALAPAITDVAVPALEHVLEALDPAPPNYRTPSHVYRARAPPVSLHQYS